MVEGVNSLKHTNVTLISALNENGYSESHMHVVGRDNNMLRSAKDTSEEEGYNKASANECHVELTKYKMSLLTDASGTHHSGKRMHTLSEN